MDNRELDSRTSKGIKLIAFLIMCGIMLILATLAYTISQNETISRRLDLIENKVVKIAIECQPVN